MKIKYEFATETVEVEVSAEMYALHMELNRVEYNNNHRETRRYVSLDTGLEHKGLRRGLRSEALCHITQNKDDKEESKVNIEVNQKNSRPYHYEFDREFISTINYSCSSQSAIS